MYLSEYSIILFIIVIIASALKDNESKLVIWGLEQDSPADPGTVAEGHLDTLWKKIMAFNSRASCDPKCGFNIICVGRKN